MTTALDALWKVSRSLSQRAVRRKALPPMLFFSDTARTPRPELTLARLPSGSGFVFRAFGAADALDVQLVAVPYPGREAKAQGFKVGGLELDIAKLGSTAKP